MNLNESIDFDIKQFFLWWGRELAFFVPENLRQRLSDKSGYVYLRIDEEKFKIFGTINGQTKTIAELDFNEQGLSHFKQLIETHDELKKARIVLSLTSRQAIEKMMALPAVAKENINQVVGFEIDKYTPFSQQQVYFSLKQVGKEENGVINIQIILTPKEILDAIFLQLNNAQVYPDIVEYENVANNFKEDYKTYNLIPEWERPAKNRVVQAATVFLSIIMTLLILAVFIYPVWHEELAVEKLKQEIKSLKNDTDFVQEQQLDLDKMIEETEKLNTVKQKMPAVLDLVNILSDLIKEDTWLTHLQLKNGRLQIQGQSPAAEGMIGILEASPLFSNVRFVSPLTQDKRTGLDRFQISANVKAVVIEGSTDG